MSEHTRAKLLNQEPFWRDRYGFFQGKGYTLRPRYHPEWKPFWKGSLFENNHEDSIFQLKGALLDASKDGRDVFIKRVDKTWNPNEVMIALRLGSPECLKDKRNHCDPILDTFPDVMDPRYEYIVMPLFRPFNEPDFTSVGEVTDFVNQILEGLVYIHEQHVAHRDLADRNILMDASKIYHSGWHPMEPWRTRDGRDVVSPDRERSEFDPHEHQRERLVTGELGRIQAPEQRSGLPYDPFKLGIYDLGYVFQKSIVNRFKGFDGLKVLGSLAGLMMQPNPEDRPNAQATLKLWEGLRLGLPPSWTRLRNSDEEDTLTRIVYDALDMVDVVRSSIGI